MGLLRLQVPKPVTVHTSFGRLLTPLSSDMLSQEALCAPLTTDAAFAEAL